MRSYLLDNIFFHKGQVGVIVRMLYQLFLHFQRKNALLKSLKLVSVQPSNVFTLTIFKQTLSSIIMWFITKVGLISAVDRAYNSCTVFFIDTGSTSFHGTMFMLWVDKLYIEYKYTMVMYLCDNITIHSYIKCRLQNTTTIHITVKPWYIVLYIARLWRVKSVS